LGRGDGGAAGLQAKDRNLKSTGFVGAMISKVSRDLLLSRNQPLKPVDD